MMGRFDYSRYSEPVYVWFVPGQIFSGAFSFLSSLLLAAVLLIPCILSAQAADSQNSGYSASKLGAVNNKGSGQRSVLLCRKVRVYFGTNRTSNTGDDEQINFTNHASYAVQYGYCDVSIPLDHQVGHIEQPNLFSSETDGFSIVNTTVLSQREFIAQAKNESKASNSALIFVHGYCMSFKEAVLHAAQLSCDLNFKGITFIWSWPTAHSAIEYRCDEASAETTTPLFEDFLQLLRAKITTGNLIILAHSMGNRIVCQAMAELLKQKSFNNKNSPPFKSIIFAAPDVDQQTFEQAAKSIERVSRNITVYVSLKDKLLALSKKLHCNIPRVGPETKIAGADIIDVSRVDKSWPGHFYYCQNLYVLADIRAVINGQDAKHRPSHLTRVSEGRFEMSP